MSKITLQVVGTTLANNNLTVYLADGSVRTFAQGDTRIEDIVTKSLQDLGRGGLSVTEIEIEDERPINGIGAILAKLEEMSKNMITFDSLDKIITAKVTEIIEGTKTEHSLNGIQKIDKYIVNAVENDQPEGVIKLIERLAKMESNREHSAQDVLDFLQSAHLPVTAQGDIIFFKSVYDEGDYCVDCYTQSIRQKPGTLVRMHESLVDPDRNAECSYGLHIASIEYASRFSGNAMLVGIVKPENIIAVPHGDTSKVRVNEYLVLHRMHSEDNEELRFTRDFTKCSKEFNDLLSNIVNGHYTYTPSSEALLTDRKASIDTVKYTNFDIGSGIPVEKVNDVKPVSKLEPIDEKALNARNTVKPSKINSRLTVAERISMYFKEIGKTDSDDNKKAIIISMLELKRKQRKPWTKLGLSVSEEAIILKLIKDLNL